MQWRMGKYDGGIASLAPVLAARRRTRGHLHEDTLESINRLGALHKAKGNFAAAQPLLEEALAAQRRTLGDENPDTLLSINNLGSLHKAKGDFAAAQPLYEEALAAYRRTLGDLHEDTKDAAMGLYNCYLGLGGHDAEMDELDRVHQIMRGGR